MPRADHTSHPVSPAGRALGFTPTCCTHEWLPAESVPAWGGVVLTCQTCSCRILRTPTEDKPVPRERVPRRGWVSKPL